MTNTTLLENNEVILQAEDLKNVVGGSNAKKERRIVYHQEVNKYKGIPGRYYAAMCGGTWYYGKLIRIYEKTKFLWATTTVWEIEVQYSIYGACEGTTQSFRTDNPWYFFEATVYV